MWYEILPSAGIILGAMCVPTIAIYGLNKLAYGTVYRRELLTPWDRRFQIRDHRITGYSYKQNGLDAIPDK